VENGYMTYNFSHFSIYLPNIITIDGNLTKFWQKQFCTVFLRHRVYVCFLLCAHLMTCVHAHSLEGTLPISTAIEEVCVRFAALIVLSSRAKPD